MLRKPTESYVSLPEASGSKAILIPQVSFREPCLTGRPAQTDNLLALSSISHKLKITYFLWRDLKTKLPL